MPSAPNSQLITPSPLLAYSPPIASTSSSSPNPPAPYQEATLMDKLNSLSAENNKVNKSDVPNLPSCPTPENPSRSSRGLNLNAQQTILNKFKKLNETQNKIQKLVNLNVPREIKHSSNDMRIALL